VVAKSTVVVPVVVVGVGVVEVVVEVDVGVAAPFGPFTSCESCAVVVGFPVCGALAVVGAPLPLGAFVV